MTRRRLLIAVAALAIITVSIISIRYLRRQIAIDRCLDLGGKWDAGLGECRGEDIEPVDPGR